MDAHTIQVILDELITSNSRLYIGMRYVPMFADPTEWDDSTEYEPLTMVTNESGDIYVSKFYVPAGVALTDTDYWIPWGAFPSGGITTNMLADECITPDKLSDSTIAYIQSLVG